MLGTNYYRDFSWSLAQPRPYKYTLSIMQINNPELESVWHQSDEKKEIFSYINQQSPTRLHSMIKKQVDKFHEKYGTDGK